MPTGRPPLHRCRALLVRNEAVNEQIQFIPLGGSRSDDLDDGHYTGAVPSYTLPTFPLYIDALCQRGFAACISLCRDWAGAMRLQERPGEAPGRRRRRRRRVACKADIMPQSHAASVAQRLPAQFPSRSSSSTAAAGQQAQGGPLC